MESKKRVELPTFSRKYSQNRHLKEEHKYVKNSNLLAQNILVIVIEQSRYYKRFEGKNSDNSKGPNSVRSPHSSSSFN
jgi:hypothetical protein